MCICGYMYKVFVWMCNIYEALKQIQTDKLCLELNLQTSHA